MLKHMLGCCKVYISESRNKKALESIERAASSSSSSSSSPSKLYPDAQPIIINQFQDEIYNRVGYTLVSKVGPPHHHQQQQQPLMNAVLAMVKAAYESINLENHSGSHPRLGVVDHICFHPLGPTTCLEHVADLARTLAAHVASHLQVPTYLYGAAHQGGRSLDSIRRELGYFRPNASGNEWAGGPVTDPLQLEPDEGPVEPPAGKGVVVIGATRWVDNYNVPVYSNDIAAVRRVAKRVSGRGGGLPTVQSMALAHGDGVIEVACNLLDPSRVGGSRVQVEVERLAGEEGLEVGKGYYTDFSQEKIIEHYLKQLSCHSE